MKHTLWIFALLICNCFILLAQSTDVGPNLQQKGNLFINIYWGFDGIIIHPTVYNNYEKSSYIFLTIEP